MTDTTTLIQRLRTDVLWYRRRGNETIAEDCRQAADALEQQAAQIEALRADAERMRGALNFIAEHMCSDWSQRCQAMVNTARAALRQEASNG